MINLKTKKQIITEAVLKQIPNIDLSIDKAMFSWWMTGRHDGLRLTDIGDLNFRLADIEFYEFNLLEDIKKNPTQEWNIFLLECNKKIKCPYYLGVNKQDGKKMPYIRFYDSKIAMMVQLYGSIKEYLSSVKDYR
jgi:hypothetical protein